MNLEQIIKDKIRKDGPLTIAEYMHYCLSHPQYGYYIKQDPFGRRGDFITAPEITQVFGELIGLWCADMWAQMGGGPAALVELGPGRGTLMQDALRATRQIDEFQDHLTVHLVETSPILQTAQFHCLQNAHERIEWESGLDSLPEKPALIIANEFFDALPIRQHVQTREGMLERCVGIDQESGELTYQLERGGLSLAKGDQEIEDGTVIESCQAAKEMMAQIATHLTRHGGVLLVIDYGYLGESHQDTLQAVREHGYAPVLKDPGDADITAHVDFQTLAEIAESQGASVHGPVNQGTFLVRIGAEIRTQQLLQNADEEQAVQLISGVKRLIDPTQMGHLFKAMAVCGQPHLTAAGFYAASEQQSQ